jgi:hypothetical protein
VRVLLASPGSVARAKGTRESEAAAPTAAAPASRPRRLSARVVAGWSVVGSEGSTGEVVMPR